MGLKTSTRQRTHEVGNELTAAAELNLAEKNDQAYARATTAHSRRASIRPWQWYDLLGEVHYAVSRSARIAGYATLKCVKRDESGKIIADVTDGPYAELVAQIQSPFGGRRSFIDRFYTLMKIPGDSYLCRVRDGDDPVIDGYHFLSPDELDLRTFSRWSPGRGKIRWITAPAAADTAVFTREIEPRDLLGRVWIPNRRYVDLTDSALMALDTECESLYLLTKTIKAKLMSRFALAGIMFLPNSIATARIGKEQEQVAGQNINNTLNFLIAAMTRNVRNWEDATAYMPILLQGNPDDGEKIKHIVMDREVFETDIQLRAELIGRILAGLDSNQDTTSGIGTESHFAAWAAGDDERRVAVQPDLEMMCWALTRLILHRQMLEDEVDPNEIVKHGIWYDLSGASIRANQQEDARQASDRGAIGDDGLRELSGIPDTMAMDEDERVRWVGRQVKNPVLMLHGLDVAKKVDWDKAKDYMAKPGPAPDSPADDPEAGPGQDSGSPDSNETDTPRTERPI